MLKGVIFSLTASFLFGYIYYFATLLEPLTINEIFGFRIILTFPFAIAAIFLLKQHHFISLHLKRIKKNPWLILVFITTSAITGFEMWLFLWAPNHNQALSVSLGYLLLPLVMVLVGRLFLKEHISTLKGIAVLLAFIGVSINIIMTGGLSWASIAVSGYALYFLLRKLFRITDLASFAIELVIMLPFCFYFIAEVDYSFIQQHNPYILWLLPLLGLFSGLAFIAYIAASNYLPINLLGLLGYAEPILLLVVSFVIGDKITPETYPLFMSLLLAMAFIIADGIKQMKAQKRQKKLKQAGQLVIEH